MSVKLSKKEIDRMPAGFSKVAPAKIPNLSEQEKDGLGEIGNISMGSAEPHSISY